MGQSFQNPWDVYSCPEFRVCRLVHKKLFITRTTPRVVHRPYGCNSHNGEQLIQVMIARVVVPCGKVKNLYCAFERI